MSADQVSLIAGVDEAGRGPLAGPVSAAAVILPARLSVPLAEGLDDSKKLTERRREALFEPIKQEAVAWCIAWASVEEIDSLNILQATMLAMQRAVGGLDTNPDSVEVDGNRCPELTMPVKAIVGGDGLIPAISAASILAKVARDRLLLDYEQQYPGYRFAQHKGYGTKAHLAALNELGVSPVHRKSFAPVRRLM